MAELTEQELHNLAMNIVGELEAEGYSLGKFRIAKIRNL